MKALFLCGGSGRRMFPLTEDKFFLRFLNKTLLEHQLDIAVAAGISRFVIVGNPVNIDRLRKTASAYPNSSFEFAVQEEQTGIAGAVTAARGFLDEEILIVNPNDIITKSAYEQLLTYKRRRETVTIVTGYMVDSHFPGGYLVTGEDGLLKDIQEKPEPGAEPSDMVNILLHLHKRPDILLDEIKRTDPSRDDAYELALSAICHAYPVAVSGYNGLWKPVKYPWHILNAMEYYLNGIERQIAPDVSIASGVVIEGNVRIEPGVRIMENAVIKGPAFIGENCVIGNNTLIRGGCNIADGCTVGFGTELKSCYVGSDCSFHMNYFGDSVIGNNCSFGAGTVSANWRFDERPVLVEVDGRQVDTERTKLGAFVGDGCRTGVNVSLMPGVRLGENTTVYPGVTLQSDTVPDTIAKTGKGA